MFFRLYWNNIIHKWSLWRWSEHWTKEICLYVLTPIYLIWPLSTKRKYRSLRLFFFNSTCAMKVQKRLHFHQLLPSTQNYSRTVAIHQTYRYHLTWLSLWVYYQLPNRSIHRGTMLHTLFLHFELILVQCSAFLASRSDPSRRKRQLSVSADTWTRWQPALKPVGSLHEHVDSLHERVDSLHERVDRQHERVIACRGRTEPDEWCKISFVVYLEIRRTQLALQNYMHVVAFIWNGSARAPNRASWTTRLARSRSPINICTQLPPITFVKH